MVDLNQEEYSLVLEIKNMLQPDNIDIQVISEVKQLLEEMKDKVDDSGKIMKERLLKNRFLGGNKSTPDTDSMKSSDIESSQVDTHLDLKSDTRKYNKSNLRRRLSKIADNAMNLKLT